MEFNELANVWCWLLLNPLFLLPLAFQSQPNHYHQRYRYNYGSLGSNPILSSFTTTTTTTTATTRQLSPTRKELSRRRDGFPPKYHQYPKFTLGSQRVVVASSSNNNKTTEKIEMILQTSPLIGGPPWLPLHVQLFLVWIEYDDDHDDDETTISCCCRGWYGWDFVPVRATEFQTLRRLLTLQNTTGVIRCLKKSHLEWADDKWLIIDMAHTYCQRYNQNLHLVNNNCWTFALQLANCLLTSSAWSS